MNLITRFGLAVLKAMMASFIIYALCHGRIDAAIAFIGVYLGIDVMKEMIEAVSSLPRRRTTPDIERAEMLAS